MQVYAIRYAFLTFYKETILLRMEPIRNTSWPIEWRIAYSNPFSRLTASESFGKATEGLEGKVSLREAMLFMLWVSQRDTGSLGMAEEHKEGIKQELTSGFAYQW